MAEDKSILSKTNSTRNENVELHIIEIRPRFYDTTFLQLIDTNTLRDADLVLILLPSGGRKLV